MARPRHYGPTHRVAGYPKGSELLDWDGRKVGRIVDKKCSRVAPHARGGWISSERCTYTAEVNGRLYTGRGRGDSIFVNFRQMKRRR